MLSRHGPLTKVDNFIKGLFLLSIQHPLRIQVIKVSLQDDRPLVIQGGALADC